MRIYAKVQQAVEAIGRAGGWLGVSVCFALMLFVVANVVGRTFGHAIPGTIDVTESSMVIVTAMLLAYTQARRGHVNVEFVTEHLPAGPRRVLSFVILLLVLAFTVFFAWQTWKLGLDALVKGEYSGTYPHIPYYPGKALLAVGVSLLGLQLIVDVWKEITNILVGTKSSSDAAA